MILKNLKESWKGFSCGHGGGGLVEYTLILAFIALVAITLLTNIGTNVTNKLTPVKTGLS